MMAATGMGTTPAGWLARFPAGFFGMTMGFAGLALAAQKVEATAEMAPVASPILVLLALVVFLLVAACYLAKAVSAPHAVRAEWRNTAQMSLIAAGTLSLLLLAAALLPLSDIASRLLWWGGTGAHLAITMAALAAWIDQRPLEPAQLNPTWFIPVVGTAVVPAAGVPLGYLEVSWFFFAFGLVLWGILTVLIFNRLMFHGGLPERMAPMHMLILAPPSILFLAYTRLVPGLDPFARVLYYVSVLFALIVATKAPRMVRQPFSVASWSFTFPLAALAISSMHYGALAGSALHIAAGRALALALAMIVAGLAVRTLLGFRAGTLPPPA